MTQTATPVDTGLEPIMGDPAPRRRFIGRLSLGHLVMVLAGLLAFLLVLAVLRDNSVTNFVAKAARDIPAGTTIGGEDVELIEITGDALAGAVLDDIGPDLNTAGTTRILGYISHDHPQPDWDTAVATMRQTA